LFSHSSFFLHHFRVDAAKLAKRLDCARLSGAFGRTKLDEPPTVPAHAKSGAKAAALQTLRDYRSPPSTS
jgi:hypothetical protein